MRNAENRSLSQITGKSLHLPDPESHSNTVRRYHQLYQLPLAEYTPGDIRFMLGQEAGEIHLVPMALRILSDNVMIDSEYYTGDLLSAVISLPKKFWEEHPLLLKDAKRVLERCRPQMAAFGADQYERIIIQSWETFLAAEIPSGIDPATTISNLPKTFSKRKRKK